VKNIVLFLLIAFLYSPLVWSQCSGVSTGGGCVPPPCTPGSPLACNQQQPQEQQQAIPQPQPVWANRWGAIVIDSSNGQSGFVAGRDSKDDAINTAMNGCTMHGSRYCRLEFVYHNQCAAIAWGPTYHNTAGAPTEALAKSDAMRFCDEKTSGCKIVYSACSMAERIR
jgi:hypothetical protein